MSTRWPHRRGADSDAPCQQPSGSSWWPLWSGPSHSPRLFSRSPRYPMRTTSGAVTLSSRLFLGSRWCRGALGPSRWRGMASLRQDWGRWSITASSTWARGAAWCCSTITTQGGRSVSHQAPWFCRSSPWPTTNGSVRVSADSPQEVGRGRESVRRQLHRRRSASRMGPDATYCA